MYWYYFLYFRLRVQEERNAAREKYHRFEELLKYCVKSMQDMGYDLIDHKIVKVT